MTDTPAEGPDAPADTDGRTRWLSYDEIAAARGIDRESAIRWARRKHWPRREGNDRTVRLAVPADVLQVTGKRQWKPQSLVRADIPADIPANDLGDIPPDYPGTINALADHVRTLRKELAAAQQAASEVPALAERVGRAEAEAVALRDALARELRQLEQAEAARREAETQRDAAQVARDATQAELRAWTVGGPLARALRALLYRR